MKHNERGEHERWTMETGAEPTDTESEVHVVHPKPVEGTLDDFDRDPFKDYTEEQREALRGELPLRQGASDYYALKYAERQDAESFQHLAQREQAVLEALASQLHTEPLLKNYDFQKKFNEGETSSEQRKTVESRLENVIKGTVREFESVDSWTSNYLMRVKPSKEHPLKEEETARIGGFGLSALESDDYRNAHLAFSDAGLLEEPRVHEAVEKKRRLLERDFASRTHRDDTRTMALLKQFESFFGEAAPERQAA